VLVMVVAAVTQHHVGAATGSAALAPPGRHGVEKWISWVTSLRLPPVRVTASGLAVASVIR
jgi:hypothetical protein